VSLYFVPAVIGVAFVAGSAWLLLGGAEFSFSLRIFVAVMVIACPCALGLATPTAIMTGTGRGAQLGVLIKSGRALETAKGLQAVILDKTGTLTEGKPSLRESVSLSDEEGVEDRLLPLIAGVENESEHPLARAVVDGIRSRGYPHGMRGIAVFGYFFFQGLHFRSQNKILTFINFFGDLKGIIFDYFILTLKVEQRYFHIFYSLTFCRYHIFI